MSYDFIAELFVNKDDKEPRYKTHLWGIKDGKTFIREIVMTSYRTSWSDGDDYIKEMDFRELTEYFPLEENPEFETLISEGEKCSKVVLYAYEIDPRFSIGCIFGKDGCFFACFEGNAPDSKVLIRLNRNSSKIMQTNLKSLKARMEVLTLYEVMDRLTGDYKDFDESSCDHLKADLKKSWQAYKKRV